MKSKQVKFILFIVGLIIIVAAIGFATNKSSSKPSKYTDFVQALKADGVHMYGAFWCPHCQAQEAALGMTRQQLETVGLYVECSNADKSQTPTCVEKKIESYPTWAFDKGITITSKVEPTLCKENKDGSVIPGEPPVCAQAASQFTKTWIFPDYKFSVKSPTDPTHTLDVWQFPSGAETTGELPLEFLASQIGYTL